MKRGGFAEKIANLLQSVTKGLPTLTKKKPALQPIPIRREQRDRPQD